MPSEEVLQGMIDFVNRAQINTVLNYVLDGAFDSLGLRWLSHLRHKKDISLALAMAAGTPTETVETTEHYLFDEDQRAQLRGALWNHASSLVTADTATPAMQFVQSASLVEAWLRKEINGPDYEPTDRASSGWRRWYTAVHGETPEETAEKKRKAEGGGLVWLTQLERAIADALPVVAKVEEFVALLDAYDENTTGKTAVVEDRIQKLTALATSDNKHEAESARKEAEKLIALRDGAAPPRDPVQWVRSQGIVLLASWRTLHVTPLDRSTERYQRFTDAAKRYPEVSTYGGMS